MSSANQFPYSISVEKSYHKFFGTLTARVNGVLKAPSSSMNQASYIFPTNIVDSPLMMSNMYLLLQLAGANIRNHIIRAFVARKLLLWLIKERPDIINEMLLP